MTMGQINIPYFFIRLLTLLCYFLPFIFFLSTCTSDSTSKDAFNKEDALINEQEKLSNKLTVIDELIKQIDTTSKNTNSVLTEIRGRIDEKSDNATNLDKDIEILLLRPTNYSLSGFGAVYYHKNMVGRIVLALSLFLSLTTLLLWRILVKRKLALIFISVNMVMVLIFITTSLLTNVSLLFGTWTLLLLLIIQLLTEIQTLKKINTADTKTV